MITAVRKGRSDYENPRRSAVAVLPQPNGGDGRLRVPRRIGGGTNGIERCDGVGGQLAAHVQVVRIDQVQNAVHHAGSFFREIGFRLRALAGPGERGPPELHFHVEREDRWIRLLPNARVGVGDRLHIRAGHAAVGGSRGNGAERIAVFVDGRKTCLYCSAEVRWRHARLANGAGDVDFLYLGPGKRRGCPQSDNYPQRTTQSPGVHSGEYSTSRSRSSL